MARLGFNFLPQPGDVDIDSSGERHRFISPDRVQQLISGNRRPTMLDEVTQQLEFTRRQLHGPAFPKHLRAAKIDSHVAELNNLP
jgi:hypothetical protein